MEDVNKAIKSEIIKKLKELIVGKAHCDGDIKLEGASKGD